MPKDPPNPPPEPQESGCPSCGPFNVRVADGVTISTCSKCGLTLPWLAAGLVNEAMWHMDALEAA
ncbi:hypothetical protein ACIBO2_48705 [Nonomuraea sp. NPDC050022]|uniref:hypothetical protein n=1 Tax=unclassified Nonomuraea TaxID=2593643 RepID=UPI0033C49447